MMTILFNVAMKWKLFPFGRNSDRTSHHSRGVKRKRRPTILSQQQFGILIANTREDHIRVLLILGMCLGLRLSELLALKWHDIDWEGFAIFVRRAIVLGREGAVKTEYSEAPAPLDPVLARVLQEWKGKTEFPKQVTGFLPRGSWPGSHPTFRQLSCARSALQPRERGCRNCSGESPPRSSGTAIGSGSELPMLQWRSSKT
jgi:integrase